MEKGIFINSHKITKEVPWCTDNYFSDIWVKDIEKDILLFCAPCDVSNHIEIANKRYFGIVITREKHKVILILNDNPEEIINGNLPVLNSDETVNNVLICRSDFPYLEKCIIIPKDKHNKFMSYFNLGDIIEIHKV